MERNTFLEKGNVPGHFLYIHISKSVGFSWIDRDKCRPIESYVSSWLEMGVTWIGGCCRVFASDIARISEEVQNWRDLNAI